MHAVDYEYENLKVPPHSEEAEQSVLGGLLINGAAFDQIADIIKESDFYRHDHRLIFRLISDLVEKDIPVDLLTLKNHISDNELLAEIGGFVYLTNLAKEVASTANIKAYAQIIREKAVLRKLIEVGNEIAASAYQTEGKSSKDILDAAEAKVLGIADETLSEQEGFINIQSALTQAIERIEVLYSSDKSVTGLSTGFTDLDSKTSGLQNSDLVIIAGRPSMGKTSFAMNIAATVAVESDKPVAIFSLEMPGEQIAMRLISSMGRVELAKLRKGDLSDSDWPKITSIMSILTQKKNIYIDESSALTPTDIRARARRLHRERGLSLIVIDYLQLLQGSREGENRTNEISEISRALKGLARELNVPVIALSQLNRSVEQRPDKRPVMSDLRESGAIEQDADVIMFIYRDEVYNEDSPDKGTAEILIRKQRNGPIGTVKLSFLGQYTLFADLAREDYYEDDY